MPRRNYMANGLEIEPVSSPPTGRTVGDIYLDDGSNTSSGNPGWRYLVSTGPDVWADVSGGSGGGGGDSVISLSETIEMGASPVEVPIGQTTYDGSTGASHYFKAVINPEVSMSAFEIRLYDKGPEAGPYTAGTLVSTLTATGAGLDIFSNALTASGSPSPPDEIYNTPRVYEARAYISADLGEKAYIGKVSMGLS